MDQGHRISARDTLKVCGRSTPCLGAHRGSNLVLFQEEWPLQDATTLALNLWNSMVSWGSAGMLQGQPGDLAYRRGGAPARSLDSGSGPPGIMPTSGSSLALTTWESHSLSQSCDAAPVMCWGHWASVPLSPGAGVWPRSPQGRLHLEGGTGDQLTPQSQASSSSHPI